jgi:adenosylcobinamide-GDP ribazoletransferase
MILRSLVGAVQILTAVPLAGRPAAPGHSALFFPLVGAALGAAIGTLLEGVRYGLPFTIAALLALAALVLLTGGLHDDGFADVADACRAYRPPEKILTILKDSRVGAHAALALTLVTLIRWQALSSIVVDPVPVLAAGLAVSRGTIVAMVWTTPPAGSGLGRALADTLTTPIAMLALLQTVLLAFLGGVAGAVFLLCGAILIVLGARVYFLRRIGGFTGDCLGATVIVFETYSFLVFACAPCIL